MHPNLKRLAECRNAREAIQAGLIQCGFEFEYHSFEETTSQPAPEDRPELPKYKQILRAMNHLYTNGGSVEPDRIVLAGRSFSSVASYLETILSEVPTLRYADPRSSGSNDSQERVRASSLNNLLEPLKMESGSDGSVRGGEIRTRGALTPKEFMAAAKTLFLPNYRWEVDEGCSFHIHLSVPGVKHQFGYQTQYRLLEGVALNSHRVPKPVVRRWRHSGAYNYYRVHLSREKYSFVHFHDQGTWEFRCWGNISTYREALQCLLLSIEALIHATYCRLHQVPNIPMRRVNVPDWVADYAGEGGEDGGGDGSDQLCEMWAALVGDGGPENPMRGVV